MSTQTVGRMPWSPWYDQQVAALSPSQRRRLRTVAARPQIVLVPAAVAVQGVLALNTGDGDGALLRTAGTRLWGPSALDVFANPWLQLGPIDLGVLGMIQKVLGGSLSWYAVAAVTSASFVGMLVWLAVDAAGRAARMRSTSVAAAQWVVGVAVAFGLGDFMFQAVQLGHPEEPLLGVLLVEVALLAASGRYRWAGLLLGLAAGVKQWAVIGGGALLLARRPRQRVVGIAIALAATAACYLPFYLFGTVSTYGYSWGWGKETAFGWLTVTWGLSGWTARALQGALAALAGMLVAWRRPGSPVLVAVAAIGVRVALDPWHMTYYAAPLAVVVLLWAWSCPALRTPARAALTAAVLAVGYAGEWVPVVYFWNGLGVAILALLIWAVRVEQDAAGPPDLAGARPTVVDSRS